MLRRSILVALLLAWTFVIGHSSFAANQPNVILIMSDDQGYGDIHAHGNSMIRTPNLDKLHGESVRFTNYHVDPTCTPTRAAMMTGRYSTRTGCWHTIMGRSLMFHGEQTMAEVFKSNGYRTAIYGKWHLGDNYPMRPHDRGFDEAIVNGGGGVTQTPDFWGNTYFDDTYFHNGKPEKYNGYCTDVWFDNAMRFMEQNKSKPFFIYLPTNVAHGPYNVAEKYAKPYLDKGVPQPMANFYGMIEELDENIGRLRAKLKQLGLADNTILMFTTDNGTAAGVANPGGAGKGKNKGKANVAASDSSWKGFNAGMRGQKGSQYEGGHRVPFFMHWAGGNIGGGKDMDTLVAHVDVLPTLADLCGLKFRPKNPLDGRSLSPLLRGKPDGWPERTLFVHTQREEIPPKWVRSAAMTQQWRLVDGKELYDMQADPGQAKNIADQHADVVAKLRADYEKWWATLTPSFTNYGYIVLGSDQENPARLTCHDWHTDNVPWHQEMIKKAPNSNGYWVVKVDKAGKYEFTLRQQPEVAKFPIAGSLATVRVGNVEATEPISSGATAVKISLNLKPGEYHLETRFHDEAAGIDRGAFFVDVRRF